MVSAPPAPRHPILGGRQDFHLILSLRIAETDAAPSRGTFVQREAFRPADLPTLMRKAYDHAIAQFADIER